VLKQTRRYVELAAADIVTVTSKAVEDHENVESVTRGSSKTAVHFPGSFPATKSSAMKSESRMGELRERSNPVVIY